MLSKKIRRQLFQIANGGPLIFLKKFPRVRSVMMLVSSLSFSNLRFWNQLGKISAVFVNSVDRDPKLDAAKLLLNHQVEEVLVSSRALIKDFKTSQSIEVLNQGTTVFPKSLEIKQSLAQVHFVRGEWPKYLSVSTQADHLMKQLADERKLEIGRLRFLGNDWTGPLGHIALLDTVIKLRELSLSSDEQRILLYDSRYSANSALLKLFVPKIANIKSDRKFIEQFSRKFNPIVDQVPMYRLKSGIVDQWSAISIANQAWSDAKRDPVITVPELIIERGSAILKRWGLQSDAWFAIMHVREGDHRAHARAQNANIATYIPMIEEIVTRGGWVIRMGSPLMTPLPAMRNVIDYAHAVERIDWMDVFLWGMAKFSVATNSGGSEVPMCFGTPVIRTNYASFGHCSFFEKSFMVPKRFKLKNEKSAMSLQHSLRTPIPWCESTVHENLEFEIIDNSEQDLVDAAVEMFSRFDKNDWTMTHQQVAAQNIRLAEGAVGGLPISQSFLTNHQSFGGS